MNKGVRRTDELPIGVGIKRVARNYLAGRGQLGFRPRPDQYANPMVALQQNRDQCAADVAGSSR